ncbi:unnamed protein product [Gordionus sp. m RMFG-2023]
MAPRHLPPTRKPPNKPIRIEYSKDMNMNIPAGAIHLLALLGLVVILALIVVAIGKVALWLHFEIFDKKKSRLGEEDLLLRSMSDTPPPGGKSQKYGKNRGSSKSKNKRASMSKRGSTSKPDNKPRRKSKNLKDNRGASRNRSGSKGRGSLRKGNSDDNFGYD